MAANTSNSNGSYSLTSILGVAVALIVFVLIVVLSSGRNGGAEEAVAEVDAKKPTAAALRAEEAEVLTTYGWVDQEKGTVRIPVDRAADLVLEELNP